MEDGFERWRDAKLPTSGEGWTYDVATNTLTLENYHGYRISAVPYEKNCTLTIKLIGENTLDGNIDYYSLLATCRYKSWEDYGFKLVFTGDGSLTLTQEADILDSVAYCGAVTMEDSCTLTINAKGKAKSALFAEKLTVGKECRLNLNTESTSLCSSFAREAVINGTLVASAPYSEDGWWAFGTHEMKLGSDRVLIAGKTPTAAKNLNKPTGESFKFYSMGDTTYQYVAITDGKAISDNSDKTGSSDETTVKKVTLSSVKSNKAGCAKLSWKKVSDADGYEIYYTTAKNGTYKKLKTITKTSTVTYTKEKLTEGKTYYFKMRAYKTVDGKKAYGKYSVIKNVKITK